MARKTELPLLRISRPQRAEGRRAAADDFIVCTPEWAELGLSGRDVRLLGGLLGICTGGNCRLSVNQERHDIRSGDLVVIFSGSVIRAVDASDDFRVSLSGFSIDCLKGVPQSGIPLYPYIRQNPTLSLTPDECAMLLRHQALLHEKAACTRHVYYREILQNLMLSLFYEISALHQGRYPERRPKLSRSEEIFKTAMRLVMQHFREQRGTAFYARELCLTPKYLSAIVKRVSNKSLSGWIDDAVILEAKNQLRSTQMTVQQIANYLNFPNPSFFGRYFKKHTGMTPKAFRGDG